MSVLEIQQALKAAGFDPGPLDGKMGPRTKAAITAYQSANGLAADGIAGPLTQAKLQGAAPAAAPTATANETYQQKYPQFAWAFNDPEVRKLLEDGVANKWGPDELQGKIQQTTWWKSKSNAERDWLQTLATNPAEASREIWNYDSISKYRAVAAQYGQTVSFEQALNQTARVTRGEISDDALMEELRRSAKALYPFLADTIDAGGTVENVFDPIRNIAAEVLGVNPATVVLSDPKWQALLTKDDNGKRRLANFNEVMQTIKFDAQYGYRGSQSGRDSAAGAVSAIREGFGLT